MTLRTAQQRRDICSSCGVAKVADLVGDSCSLIMLRDLLEGPRRFSELQTSLAGVSTRTLANKLKFLAREGLIAHTPSSAKDSPAGYKLTKKGEALGPVIEAMRAYGKKYL